MTMMSQAVNDMFFHHSRAEATTTKGDHENITDSLRSGPSLAATEVSCDSLSSSGSVSSEHEHEHEQEEDQDAHTTPPPPVSEVAPVPLRERSRTVSFGNLAELEFTVIKGDQKYETAYPMTLGRCVSETSHNLDDYEEIRQPHRQKGEALRLKPEERKQIIKNSKKAHKRRNSIGNGEISRLSAASFFTNSSNKSSSDGETQDTQDSPATEDDASSNTVTATRGRPKLRRQNSIGNGEISRLSKKSSNSSLNKFLQALNIKTTATNTTTSSSNNSSRSITDPASVSMEEDSTAFSETPMDASTTSTAKTPGSPTKNSSPTSKSGGRPKLRRQNSIGNGEISRLGKKQSLGSSISKLLIKPLTTSSSKNSSKNDSKDNSPPASPKSPSSSSSRRPTLRRQNSIGNGEISRLSNRQSSSSSSSSFSKLLQSLSSTSSKNNTTRSSTTAGPSLEVLQAEVAVTTGNANPRKLMEVKEQQQQKTSVSSKSSKSMVPSFLKKMSSM